MDYLGLTFEVADEEIREVLYGILIQFDFEGIEESSHVVRAYILKSKFNPDEFKDTYQNIKLFNAVPYHITDVEERNWNSIWESGFDPVKIDHRLGIRASFHQPLNTSIELVIDPKMSFGTGHHATTEMIMKLMLDMDFSGKSVLDVGSGSGILSILAGKLGADRIIAMDNDENAVSNCKENAHKNQVTNIQSILQDELNSMDERFDVVLMNINKNTIIGFTDVINKVLKYPGILIISGFLDHELGEISASFFAHGLYRTSTLKEHQWVSAMFTNKEKE